ncbi:Putative protein [Zobellia galactanivorans]|uniref:Uncharacterized protein n=1 Tax=Zobellia galactanivorans (strain DSM 12802 / CCUG 47099 / CIP 106680 / NCIMB 13871 / Dsij) TaxID=63186 RepID=G0L8E6_ZOBGA|nr:Putative protein [Zobellia galactanivorans]
MLIKKFVKFSIHFWTHPYNSNPHNSNFTIFTPHTHSKQRLYTNKQDLYTLAPHVTTGMILNICCQITNKKGGQFDRATD